MSSAATLVGVLPVLFYCEILKTLEQIIKTVYIFLLHYDNNNTRNVVEVIISDLRGKMSFLSQTLTKFFMNFYVFPEEICHCWKVVLTGGILHPISGSEAFSAGKAAPYELGVREAVRAVPLRKKRAQSVSDEFPERWVKSTD